MKVRLTTCGLAILSCALPGVGQQAPAQQSPQQQVPQQQVPLYTVTVVERSTPAVNYQYRNGPTKIDFRGTVLLPSGKGDATVESLRGRTQIDAKLENLLPPTRYGREYMTYVLWAITPEGAAHNLGEVVPDGSNKARLRVTTDLQAFGLIVTAEPYSTTRQPGDVVVLENEIRPDTLGTSQPIQAKYELLPRGQYTWQVPDNLKAAEAGPKVSMDKYEEYLEIYEAQNAIAIARAAGADTYAADTVQKAQGLLDQARQLQASKASNSTIVQHAREAAQTAEDARLIAERRRQEEKVASAQADAAKAQQAQEEALNRVRQAQIAADSARAQADAERSQLDRAQTDAAQADRLAQQPETAIPQPAANPAPPPVAQQPAADKTQFRMRVFEQLNGFLPTRDTPRGLTVTIADSSFSGSELHGAAAEQVSRLASIMAAYPRLRLDVEGYTDSPATTANSWNRAQAVQRILLERGLPPDRVSVHGLGDARPLASNSSPAGRAQNRRVEIVISGEPIGSRPYWDRTYSLVPGGVRTQ